MIDASGKITTDQASQQLLAANAASSAIRFQNVGGSPVWLNSGGPAVPGAGSFQLQPGDSIDESYLPVDGALNIYGYAGESYTLKYE